MPLYEHRGDPVAGEEQRGDEPCRPSADDEDRYSGGRPLDHVHAASPSLWLLCGVEFQVDPTVAASGTRPSGIPIFQGGCRRRGRPEE